MIGSFPRSLVPTLLSSLLLASSAQADDSLFDNTALNIPYWDDTKAASSLKKRGVSLARWLPESKEEPAPQKKTTPAELLTHVEQPTAPIENSAVVIATEREKPAQLSLDKVGASLDIAYLVEPGMQVFVRDSNIVSFEQDSYRLTALADGETEVYLVKGSDMRIANLKVGKAAQPDLEIDVDFTQIAVVDAGNNPGESYASLSQPYKPGVNVPSLKDARTNALDEYSILPQTIKLPKRDASTLYKKIAIRVTDQFSSGNERNLRPIPGVDVSLLGSAFKGRTDVRGIVEIADVPAGSRFQVAVTDTQGRILTQLVDIPTEKTAESELFTIRSMSYEIFTLYTESVQVTQQADLSSMCLRLLNDDGSMAMSGLNVRIKNDRDADGPYYFNRFAPSLQQTQTGADGRLCYFNLEPGLVELEVFEENDFVSSATIAVAAASHLEDDLLLTSASSVTTRIVALPSVTDMLYRDVTDYFPIDYVDLHRLSDFENFDYLAPGLLRMPRGGTAFRGRSYAMVDVSDFESSLHIFDEITDRGANGLFEVTHLLQRGFSEDLFLMLNEQGDTERIAYDPMQGKIFVRHGIERDVDADKITFKLIDQYGREEEGAWIFGDSSDGFVKAFFFNLDPGVYNLIVQTSDNFWLDATTIPVDYDLTSIVQTGSQLDPKSPLRAAR